MVSESSKAVALLSVTDLHNPRHYLVSAFTLGVNQQRLNPRLPSARLAFRLTTNALRVPTILMRQPIAHLLAEIRRESADIRSIFRATSAILTGRHAPSARLLGWINRYGMCAFIAQLAFFTASATEKATPGAGTTVTEAAAHSAEQPVLRVESERGTWRIRRSSNPHGSFVLVRNGSSVALSVSYDDIAAESLVPSEATTIDCSRDTPTRTLVLGMDHADIIHSGRVACGDAIEISLVEPSTESPSESSLQHASLALTDETDLWRVSHTKNTNGKRIVIRNIGGRVSVARPGRPPVQLESGQSTAWFCDGPHHGGADVEIRGAENNSLYKAYVVCGDGLAVTKVGE